MDIITVFYKIMHNYAIVKQKNKKKMKKEKKSAETYSSHKSYLLE